MSRVYGRDKNGVWQTVTTDANGFDDAVDLTWLGQVCLLNWQESPFWADWGIPSHQAVVMSLFPTYYIQRIQQQFSSKFTSVSVQQLNLPNPTYDISVITKKGSQIITKVAL